MEVEDIKRPLEYNLLLGLMQVYTMFFVIGEEKQDHCVARGTLLGPYITSIVPYYC